MYNFEVKLQVSAISDAFDRQRHIFLDLFAIENISNNCCKALYDFSLQLG
jgi:hypothetical protein